MLYEMIKEGVILNYVIFLIMFLTAFIAAQLAIYIFYNRKKIYLKGFLGLILSVFTYSLFYSFELISPDLNYMKLLAAVQYIGILSIPAFWVIMALEYTNKSKYVNVKLYIIIFCLPVILVILNFTNEYHHLFYRNYSVAIVYSLSIANISPGIGYTMATIYINLMCLLGNILYIEFFIKNNVYRKRSFTIMITSFIPWIGYWIYMSGIMPIKIDIVPVFMAILCLFYVKALSKNNIFETAVIARHIIFDNIKEFVIVLDMNNKIIDINKTTEQFFNKEASIIIGQDIAKALEDFTAITKYLKDNKEVTFDFEMKTDDKQHYFRGEITFINNDGKVVILKDNTEQILMIKRLQYYATMDILTEVYNRNHFYSVANERILYCIKNNQPISLVMVDLDKFKNINDTYGHSAGDLILKNVIAICKACLGKNHTIGRYGGEEFLIILEKFEEEQILEIVEKIRVKIMNFNNIYEGKIIKVTCSFGIFTSIGLTDLNEMIRNADEALYKSKNEGRNRISIKNKNISI